MLDIRHQHELAWAASLQPIGEGDHEKEAFEDWWVRVQANAPALHPKIYEQWVHRHWRNSPYCFLELERLSWRLESWPTARILSTVHISGWQLDPQFDYEVFNASNRWGGHPTSRAMNVTGTWDYPLLVLETPSGIIDYDMPRPDVPNLLIEGHSRFRYLNALASRGRVAENHDIFILAII